MEILTASTPRTQETRPNHKRTESFRKGRDLYTMTSSDRVISGHEHFGIYHFETL